MSFWRSFAVCTISMIDTILDRPEFTLEDLLDQEEILQECKSHNRRLLDYLLKPEILSKLIDYITQEPASDAHPKQKFKYPLVSCEILCSDVWTICEVVYENEEMLERLYGFLDQDPLNYVLASYVCRVAGSFLQRKVPETINFLKKRGGVVEACIKHLDSLHVIDLLLKLISCEDTNDGKGVLEWLCQLDLIPKLISQFDPAIESEIHENAAQCLIDIINISCPNQETHNYFLSQPKPRSLLMIQLESWDIVNQLLSYILHPGATTSLLHGIRVLIEMLKRTVCDQDNLTHTAELSDLPPLLQAVLQKIPQFKDLLLQPPPLHPAHSTIENFEPLGFNRLRVVEIIVYLVHTNYPLVSKHLLEAGLFDLCFDLFFKYHLNNLLHFTLYQMIDSVLKSENNTLKIQLLRDCKLLEKILKGSKENDADLQKPRGTRKCYMGFLTTLSAQIINEASHNSEVQTLLNETPEWKTFVENSLNPIRQVESTPLGGQRPTNQTERTLDEEEIAEASAQAIFTQYLAQQGFPSSYQDINDDEDDDYDDDESNEQTAFELGPFNRALVIDTDEKYFQVVDDDADGAEEEDDDDDDDDSDDDDGQMSE